MLVAGCDEKCAKELSICVGVIIDYMKVEYRVRGGDGKELGGGDVDGGGAIVWVEVLGAVKEIVVGAVCVIVGRGNGGVVGVGLGGICRHCGLK